LLHPRARAAATAGDSHGQTLVAGVGFICTVTDNFGPIDLKLYMWPAEIAREAKYLFPGF
jgi:hypothetical protein